MVTPALFARYPTPPKPWPARDPPERRGDRPVDRASTAPRRRTWSGMAQALVERFGGEVPDPPGGPGHVARGRPQDGQRGAQRGASTSRACPSTPTWGGSSAGSGLTTETDPVKVELELDAMVPAAERGRFSLRLILHGRRVCEARSPRCESCVLADICPSARVPVAAAGRSSRRSGRNVRSRRCAAWLYAVRSGYQPGSRHLVRATPGSAAWCRGRATAPQGPSPPFRPRSFPELQPSCARRGRPAAPALRERPLGLEERRG